MHDLLLLIPVSINVAFRGWVPRVTLSKKPLHVLGPDEGRQ